MSAPSNPRPFLEQSEAGLLWLINRVVFHPRGLALALHEEGGVAHGWELRAAPAGEPFIFPEDVDTDSFRCAEETLRAALTKEQ